MNKIKNSLCFSILSLFLTAAVALGEPEQPLTSPIAPLQFRVSGIAILEESALGSSFSACIDWTPSWQIDSNWNLGLNLGIIPFSQLSNDPLGFEYQVTAGRKLLLDIWFEVGAGAQSWTKGANTAALLTGTFYYHFPDLYLGVLDRAFFSYSSFLVPGLYTSEFKIGFGFSF
jgi:hypothetical protein